MPKTKTTHPIRTRKHYTQIIALHNFVCHVNGSPLLVVLLFGASTIIIPYHMGLIWLGFLNTIIVGAFGFGSFKHTIKGFRIQVARRRAILLYNRSSVKPFSKRSVKLIEIIKRLDEYPLYIPLIVNASVKYIPEIGHRD